MRLVKKVFLVMAMLCATQAFAAVELGKDYGLLQPMQPTVNPNKVEVREFFFYGCPHCYHLHPMLSAWVKKMPKYAEMVYVPTVFRPDWEPMANTYYALELMGKEKELKDALYKAWNEQNLVLTEQDKIADFVAQHGVDRQKFNEFYNSFTVESKVARSKQMVLEYHIQGTPTLVVDGKYVISNLQPDRMMEVLDEVVRMAHKEHTGKR
jgi:protein dithiol oxidoreductase (disulfide-forming)